MNLIQFALVIGILCFAGYQVYGLVKDLKRKSKRRKSNVKGNEEPEAKS